MCVAGSGRMKSHLLFTPPQLSRVLFDIEEVFIGALFS